MFKKKFLSILLIADPVISVPPRMYGGTERVVHLFAREFYRLGHTVHMLAGHGSRRYGGRLHIHHAASKAYRSRARRKAQFQFISLWAARGCDVVYNFGRFDYLEALLLINKPLIHCFENQIDKNQIEFAESRMRSRAAFHFISKNQYFHAHVKAPSVFFPNPVDTCTYSIGSGDGDYLAFLGRLTFNKGVDIAIKVALITGRKLVIAGNVSKEEGGEKFFYESVQPHIDGERIRWIGPVNDQQKQELLGNAEALLFPIRWDEPFGIVMIEALACGTPVIAMRRGSAPEVIDHGLTGFLCNPAEPCAEAFADALTKLDQLDRRDCRRAAEERFDVRVVAPKVLEVMSLLVQGCSLP